MEIFENGELLATIAHPAAIAGIRRIVNFYKSISPEGVAERARLFAERDRPFQTGQAPKTGTIRRPGESLN